MDATQEFEKHGFFHWFVIAALAGIEITDGMTCTPRNITMQINGEEINPVKAIERLEEEFDRLVEKKAQERFDDKKDEVLEPFEKKVAEMTEALNQLIADKLKPVAA